MSVRSGHKGFGQRPVRRRNPARSRPLVVGLTGGLACGKSEVGRLLARQGAALLDTDTVAHELMAKGRPVYRAIVRRFGRGVLNRRKEIDRRALGRRVFASREDRKALEAIVHPPVLAFMRSWLRARRRQRQHAVVMVPLLYEIGLTRPWDVVICVTAPEAVVRDRLKARGWTAEEARARQAAQMPMTEKARRADYVIRNDGSLDKLEKRVRALWRQILREERSENDGT